MGERTEGGEETNNGHHSFYSSVHPFFGQKKKILAYICHPNKLVIAYKQNIGPVLLLT